jgi:transposase
VPDLVIASDILGACCQRILRALAQGETDPARLAQLGDKRLRASDAELMDALSGQPQEIHRQLLSLYLVRLDLIESQMASLDKMIVEAMKAHQDAIVRLAELPGLGIDWAQHIIAEIGPQAAAFLSAAQLASWIGVCPGRQEGAGVSSSDRSSKGNRSLRRLLNQLAHAASARRLPASDCFPASNFAHGIWQSDWTCPPPLPPHLGVTYVEYGSAPNSDCVE